MVSLFSSVKKKDDKRDNLSDSLFFQCLQLCGIYFDRGGSEIQKDMRSSVSTTSLKKVNNTGLTEGDIQIE